MAKEVMNQEDLRPEVLDSLKRYTVNIQKRTAQAWTIREIYKTGNHLHLRALIEGDKGGSRRLWYMGSVGVHRWAWQNIPRTKETH